MSRAYPDSAPSSSRRSHHHRHGHKSGDDEASLQDRLHTLINRLAETTEILKSWPESEGDDSTVHVETTGKLIASLHKIIHSIKSVEEKVKSSDGSIQASEADIALRKCLEESEVPFDLLDLMDSANGLNPDCFARGLLREAMRQLDGLKRRKLALEMLGGAISAGLAKRERERLSEEKRKKEEESSGNNKRQRESAADDGEEPRSDEPHTKRKKEK
mmetsp:Transcript_35408/g.53582  ORF Transcript_35408/g.53582 Transcript_35408/m.53582 type:complete len:217 (+) Transcript_35408:78-728(+)